MTRYRIATSEAPAEIASKKANDARIRHYINPLPKGKSTAKWIHRQNLAVKALWGHADGGGRDAPQQVPSCWDGLRLLFEWNPYGKGQFLVISFKKMMTKLHF